MQKIYTGYYPRRLQDSLHGNIKRFNVLVCHRRFGKTIFAVNEMIDQAMRNPRRNPQYAYLAPTYGAAKRIVWDVLKEYTKNVPGVNYHEADLRCEWTNPQGQKIKILLLGAETPGSLRGIYLDGVILDEYAEMDPVVWSQVIRPALSDRKGWAIFIGTPKGNNHFKDMYDTAIRESLQQKSDWYAKIYKASETGVLPQEELDAARKTMSQDEYDQEFECSFTAALLGAYYKEEFKIIDERKQVGRVWYDPHVPVHTAWDLGIDDSTAIWFFQLVGKEKHFIDYIEMSGRGLEYFVKEIKSRPYNYANHYLPHDAAARELGTGKTRQELLVKLGLGGKERVIIVTRAKVEDGIAAARLMLPNCWFDSEKCFRGIEALRNYEREYDSKENVFRLKPRHNWASHGADAFRTAAVGVRKDDGEFRDRKELPMGVNLDYDIFGV